MFSFSARHAVEVICRLVSAGIGPQVSSWSWIAFPIWSIKVFFCLKKNRQHYCYETKKKLNASHIFTPGLNYCTAQSDLYLNSLRLRFCRSCPAYLAFAVQMQWLVSTTNSASAFQQSSWTNRKSSLSLLIGGTISIIRGLSVGEEKRLQMVCNYCTFFSAAFDLLFFSPLLPFKLFARTQFGNLAAKLTAICS